MNSGRGPNPFGHIVRFVESKKSDTAFEWDVFLLAGDSAVDARVPADQPVFGSPDGIWVDPAGVVWIQTDISNSVQNRPPNYANIGNNQILAADPSTGTVKRFLTSPRGSVITGVAMTPDLRTMFVNVQHPGESTTHRNSVFGAPSPALHWLARGGTDAAVRGALYERIAPVVSSPLRLQQPAEEYGRDHRTNQLRRDER